MTRSILPFAILPLDEFGHEIASSFEEAIELAEPKLIESGWLEVLPVWSLENSVSTLRTIEKLLTQSGDLGYADYQSAEPYYQKVFIILLGSLTLHKEVLIEKLTDFITTLDEQLFLPQISLMPICDISKFAQDPKQNGIGALQELQHSFAGFAGAKPFVYLVDNYSEQGLRCNTRDEIMEAIRLFMESLVLGHFWDDYREDWLNTQPENENLRFASFAILSLASPQGDLLKYLSYVGYHQAWINDQGNSELSWNDNLFPEKIVVDSDTANSEKPSYNPPKPPQFFETKQRFIARLEASRNAFEPSLHTWVELLKSELNRMRFYCSEKALSQTSEYFQPLQENIEMIIEHPPYVEKIVQLQNWLHTMLNHQEKRTGKLEQIDTYFDDNLLGTPRNPYRRIYHLAEKLPNPISLIVYVLLLGLFQVLILRHLQIYWAHHPPLMDYIFWGSILLWLVGTAYLAWRFPSWRIGNLIKTRISKSYETLINSAELTYDKQKKQLEHHWSHKRNKSIDLGLKKHMNNISLANGYLTDRANQIKEEYPYPTINWEKLGGKASVFRYILEPSTNLQSIVRNIYKQPELFYADFKQRKKDLAATFLEGNVEVSFDILMKCIRGQYATTPFQIEPDMAIRLKKVVTTWQAGKENPLFVINRGLDVSTKRSKNYCLRNQAWEELLQDTLDKDGADIAQYHIEPKDRLYFFSVFYGLRIEDIVVG